MLIPTLPRPLTVKTGLVDELMVNGERFGEVEALIERRADGVVEPMPTLPY